MLRLSAIISHCRFTLGVFIVLSNLHCAHFKPRIHFLDLRSLLLKLGRENLYFFLLLRHCCLQLLNFAIEHGVWLGALGSDALGRLRKKSTRVGSIDGSSAQSSIGIDEHESCRPCGDRRTEDVLDKAPVTDLAENTVHTRQVADDDIVIGGGDTIPGVSAYGHVVASGLVAIER